MNTPTRISLLGALALFALSPLFASAMEVQANKEAMVAAGATVMDDQYLAGGTVTAAGNFSRDLAVAGGTVLVSGPIVGELLAVGGNLTFTGTVGSTARIAGGNLIIQGAVGHDLVAAGGQVIVGGPGIAGSALLAGGTVSLSAPVKGDLRIAGGDVTIDAPISGNVEVRAQRVTLGSHATIGGTFTYTAPQAATVMTGAVITGATTYHESKEVPTPTKAGIAAAAAAIFSLLFFGKVLASLVGALAIGLFFKRYAREIVKHVVKDPWGEVGRGLVVAIVMPVASILLFFTVVGIPLGILGLLVSIVLFVFTGLTAPVVAGSLVHKWIWKPGEYQVNWKIILLGVAVMLVLDLIPLIGWLIRLGIFLATLGAVAALKWSVAKEWR